MYIQDIYSDCETQCTDGLHSYISLLYSHYIYHHDPYILDYPRLIQRAPNNIFSFTLFMMKLFFLLFKLNIILPLAICYIICNVSSIVIVVSHAQLVSTTNSTSSGNSSPTDAVGVICNATVYPEVCSKSFSQTNLGFLKNASAHTLVSIALKAASVIVKESRAVVKSCSTKGSQPFLTPLELQAIQDCTTLMDMATDQLSLVIANLSTIVTPMPKPGIGRWPEKHGEALLDLEAWLSGALSLQSTCADGVTVSGPVVLSSSKSGSNCRARILKSQARVWEVLTNSLDLVKKLASHGDKLANWKHQKGMKAHPRRHMLDTDPERVDKTRPDDNAKHPSQGYNVKKTSQGDEAYSVRNTSEGDNAEKGSFGFPHWVTRPQRELLRGMAAGPASLSLIPDLIVAKDGSRNFTTVTDALASIDPADYLPAGRRFVVYIRRGIYNETFEVDKSLVNLTFVGDGINATIITGNNNVGSGNYTTFRSATVGISAVGFWAIDMTFRNTAGPEGYQAVALRASADLAVFYRCGFEGYQDTLYALAARQFYRDCRIYGTVDFIFGNAIACFQNCDILCRTPLRGQQNTVTAQGRKTSVDISGYSFENCSIVASEELVSANFTVASYLGRPWKAYSRTVFMDSFLDSLVDPAGWLSWNSSDPFLDTLYYAEYHNYGPGSATDGRVGWPGVHTSLNYTDALAFGAENFILGSAWLPLHVITYTSSPSLLP